jgi:hypothetical protein
MRTDYRVFSPFNCQYTNYTTSEEVTIVTKEAACNFYNLIKEGK